MCVILYTMNNSVNLYLIQFEMDVRVISGKFAIDIKLIIAWRTI